MLCSPTEPKRLRKLGKTSWTPEEFGADFLILGKKKRLGVQRKQFPGDLISSLTDGRLYDQLPRLRDLDQAILVLEGRGRWTEDGELLSTQYHKFHINQLHGLLFTIMFEFGIPTLWVDSMDETADVLTNLEAWMKKDKHTSLTNRPGPEKTSFGTSTDKHLAQHILQGFPGIGPALAGRIVDHFEGVPLTFTHGPDELMEVEGLGKVKAEKMVKALDAVKVK